MGTKKKSRSKQKKSKHEEAVDQQMEDLGLTHLHGNCYVPYDVVESLVAAVESGDKDEFCIACKATGSCETVLRQLMDLNHKLQVEYFESFKTNINQTQQVRNLVAEKANRRLQGFKTIASELIDEENIDTKDLMGWTVIHHAASNGLDGLLHQAIELGSSIVDTTDIRGYTPLLVAIDGDRVDICSYLIQHGADSNAQTSTENPQTCLMMACENGNFAICDLLIAHGADVNAVLPSGDTALHVASFQGHTEIVKLLCDSPSINVNLTNGWGQTALFGCSNVETATVLLDGGVDPEIRDQDDETAWSIAVALNDHLVAAILTPI